MTSGLYGYYDIKKQYVVYIGEDAHIEDDKRYNDHKSPSNYNAQRINMVVQNNPDRYVYFKFIEGNYDEENLKKLEKEAIHIFKTYKYDYPEKNVFNFTRGGDGVGVKQDNPNWRNEDYAIVKHQTKRDKSQFCIMGRNHKRIKYSMNKEKLEELIHKLNNHEITEEEVKNLRLHDTKEQIKNAIQAGIKYNIWDIPCCRYYKANMFQNDGGDKPRRCFGYKYKNKTIPIGYFNEFVSCQVIDSIVQEEVKKCQPDN